MGSGRWSTDVYKERERIKAGSGKSTFDYFDRLRSSVPRSNWKAHQTLNPFGVKTRESRDSAEHPNSVSIAVLFDVTGSMLNIPRTLQRKLPELLGLLLRKSYVQDPQILFGAIGDATCDRVPLQIGQFESDNRMDENLENFVLEGGGGGQRTESYELAMYFMARHTDIDCWNKRRHKGYLFIIGDEMAYGKVKRDEVRAIIGDKFQFNIALSAIVAELKHRYEVFYILPTTASYGGDSTILDFWRRLLGQNVLELADPEAVCEVIALTIGLGEGAIDLEEGLEHLNEMGVDDKTVSVVSTALTRVSKAVGPVARVVGSIPGLKALVKPDDRASTIWL